MSNSVSSFEIEDVLSSIRRLVSVDEREHKHHSGSGGNIQEKLVLSPALRIDDDSAEDQRVVAEDVVDTALTDQDGVAEQGSDESEDQAEPRPEPDNESSEQTGADEDAVEDRHDEPQVAQEDHSETEIDQNDDDNAGWKVLTFSHSEYRALASEIEGASDGEAVTFEEKIAEVEAAVATQEDQWEPDEPSDIDFFREKAEPIAWDGSLESSAKSRDDAETVADDTDQADAVASDGADVGQNTDPADEEWLAGDTELDEDALRDLISEIVRQELQGALGERITRNVRKLVRREIHRALVAQNFD